jgi:integrase
MVSGTREQAERILDELIQRAYTGVFGWPTVQQTTIAELVDLVVDDYKLNTRKSLRSAQQLAQFWKSLTGSLLAERVTSTTLRDWAKMWVKQDHLSGGRVNRRMSFLLRGFSLGLEHQLITQRPKWARLKEAPPRSGFFIWEQFTSLRDELPLHARVPVTIDYWSGMRWGEITSLVWNQVLFDHRRQIVRIALAGTDTKTSEPRALVMGGDLYEVLREWQRTSLISYPDCQWVCHYMGRRLKSIRTAWQKACVKLGFGKWTKPKGKMVGQRGYVGALLHDFRRTGVKNLSDAGVPEKIAMAISGHKTRSIFDRYNIVSEARLEEAGALVVARHRKLTEEASDGLGEPVTPIPQ